MQTLRVSLFAFLVLALSALTASAQPGPITPGTPASVYVPTGSYPLFWDPPPAWDASAPPENKITGYQLAAFVETTTGVIRKTWDFGLTTTYTVPGSDLGNVINYLSLRAKSTPVPGTDLYSAFSNTLPFVPASAPPVPGRLRRTATPTP
jgi:hypothetical protein